MTDEELTKMCDLAVNCNTRTLSAVEWVASLDGFSTDDWCANQQARVHLLNGEKVLGRLEDAVTRWKGLGPRFVTYGLHCIKVAATEPEPPIFVDDESYLTAHEAAIACAEVVLSAWTMANLRTAIRPPDRDICEDISRQLHLFQCPDLEEQIERECSNAMADWEVNPADDHLVDASKSDARTEPMTRIRIGKLFLVHRNQVKKLVLDKYHHEVEPSGRIRMLVSDMPATYQPETRTSKK